MEEQAMLEAEGNAAAAEAEAAQIDPNSVHGKISSALETMRRAPKSRELSIAITKGEECLMWLDRDSLMNR